MSQWPEKTRTPANGWTLDKRRPKALCAPDGTLYGPDDPLSLAQAAEIRGTTQGYMNIQVHRGKVTARKVGNYWQTTAAEAVRA